MGFAFQTRLKEARTSIKHPCFHDCSGTVLERASGSVTGVGQFVKGVFEGILHTPKQVFFHQSPQSDLIYTQASSRMAGGERKRTAYDYKPLKLCRKRELICLRNIPL
jgi:hypothetical protein